MPPIIVNVYWPRWSWRTTVAGWLCQSFWPESSHLVDKYSTKEQKLDLEEINSQAPEGTYYTFITSISMQPGATFYVNTHR